MEYFPWFAWVVIAGIFAYCINSIAELIVGRKVSTLDDQRIDDLEAKVKKLEDKQSNDIL